MNRIRHPRYFLAVMVALLIGCATTRPPVMERYGLVVAENGHWGSVIIAGNGFAYLAKHVIEKDSVTLNPFYIFFRGTVDSTSTVIASEGDMVLIRTFHGRPLEPVSYAHANYLQEVVWVQPQFGLAAPPHLYLIVGKTARRDSLSWYLDRAVYPGASGSGVWDGDGELVGMLQGISFYDFGAVYGSFLPIPPKLIERTRPPPKLEYYFNERSP